MANNKKEPVYLSMTGEQFKKLIEGKDPNNVVDTLHEILAMFDGISDGETIAEYIQRVAVTPDSMPAESVGSEQLKPNAVRLDNINGDVMAESSDIDTIFD